MSTKPPWRNMLHRKSAQRQQTKQINSPISICKFVVTLAAEAKLSALFYSIQEGTILQLALEELGYPQPPTPVHCNNITAVGIANNTVKKQ